MDAGEFQIIVDACVDIIVRVQGKTQQGGEFWAYVAVPPSKYEGFKKAEAAGNYRLNDWGRILRHGIGRQPPAAVREEMKAVYGASDTFESEINALMNRTSRARWGGPEDF